MELHATHGAEPMPSPFPGMDPYLEASDIWPDFHDGLAGEIRRELNRRLPPPYYARLEMRPEVGIVGGAPYRRIVPDVSVQETSRPLPTIRGGAVAVAEEARTEISKSVQIVVASESIRHHYIEVRDSRRSHKLVTLIEIVSPSNKRPGPDRDSYEAKQQEVQQSDASLIEIDLLRSGRPVVGGMFVADAFVNLDPPADYLIDVNRAWQRGTKSAHQLFPIGIRDMLPCIPIPLGEGEDEVPLDLQYVFKHAYDAGPYSRGAVDYSQPCDPPLEVEDTTWAEQLLNELEERTE